MAEEFGVLQSDEDSEDENFCLSRTPPEIQGTLSKWTNYIHGWQNRFMILRDGTLSYYKHENEASYGCRGSISVRKAVVKPHEIDECRFDVCLNDCVWYLRTTSAEEKHQWVDIIEQHKESEGLRRHGSAISLTSGSFSTASTSSYKRTKGGNLGEDNGLREKLAEMETYRDIVVRQMDALQTYFDLCAEATKLAHCNGLSNDHELGNDVSEIPYSTSTNANTLQGSLKHPSILNHISPEAVEKHATQAIDFRGEALTFKATTAGILTTLGHCLDVITQKEETFKRRLEKEIEKRKKLEEKLKRVTETIENRSAMTKYVVMGGPDYEEGPHSVIGEEEFYDAVESALDKMEEEEEFRERLRQKQRNSTTHPGTKHPLWPEIDRHIEEQVRYSQEGVEEGGWQLFAKEGEMKMYKKEMEVDGLVVDPLKAVHQVRGVTAHEMAHHFWSPDVRFEWDTSIEQMTVVDQISSNTLIFLQVHKRVWPTAQRDALFWSHIRKAPNTEKMDPNTHDTWVVCNRSTEHPDAPNDGKCVRVDLIVSCVCQTIIEKPHDKGGPLTRDDIQCRITYCSSVNPGGWAPSSVLRAVYKREYPKFLKRFTQYVIDKCQDQPIAFSGLQIRKTGKHWRM